MRKQLKYYQVLNICQTKKDPGYLNVPGSFNMIPLLPFRVHSYGKIPNSE